MREVTPRPLYQGPRQEKHFRKQRQLLRASEASQSRQQVVSQPDSQQSTALVTIPCGSNVSPRVRVPHPAAKSNIVVIGAITLACLLEAVALVLNSWFAWTTGRSLEDRVLMASLGFLLEGMVFILPPLASLLWARRRYISSIVTFTFFVPLFAFAVYNSLGFTGLNLTDTTTARAERITPSVADAVRRLDTLSASRKDECLKRGDRCRQLEKDEQSAIEALRMAREKVSLTADPQTQSAAKVVSWASLGRLNPSADDFGNFKLLVLAVFSQLGGLFLMASSTLLRK